MFAQHLALALTTASVTMQLMSGGIIFDHACRQIMDTAAASVTVLISVQPYEVRCFIFINDLFSFTSLGLLTFQVTDVR